MTNPADKLDRLCETYLAAPTRETKIDAGIALIRYAVKLNERIEATAAAMDKEGN